MNIAVILELLIYLITYSDFPLLTSAIILSNLCNLSILNSCSVCVYLNTYFYGI